MTIIPLTKIEYDPYARNGTWCKSPYSGHPKGCPNFVKGCTAQRPDFKDIPDKYDWFAVVEEYDLKSFAGRMKVDHPQWTDRQCRNPWYWQEGVRKKLRDKALAEGYDILLDIPEACGINVFETMAAVDVIIERNHPSLVKKVMIIGKKRGK